MGKWGLMITMGGMKEWFASYFLDFLLVCLA